MKKKIVYYLIGTCLFLFICIALSNLYFYTGKIKKLECQATGSYFQNQRNFTVSFQRGLPIKLENWMIYTADKVSDEFRNLYEENQKINDFRKNQKHVTSSIIDKTENSFTLYTVVNTRWVNVDELEQIDGFYKMIFSNGKKINHVKEYLEKNDYTCIVNE